MGDAVVLLTTAEIDAAEFAVILTCLGGTLDSEQADRGRVSRGRQHVWIYRKPESLDSLLRDDTPETVIDRIIAKLGAPPRSGLVLNPSRQPGTQRLVIDIAKAFAGRWQAVLWDIDEEILDLSDLRRRSLP